MLGEGKSSHLPLEREVKSQVAQETGYPSKETRRQESEKINQENSQEILSKVEERYQDDSWPQTQRAGRLVWSSAFRQKC